MIPALHPIPLKLNVLASERMLNLWLTIEHRDGVGENRLTGTNANMAKPNPTESGSKRRGNKRSTFISERKKRKKGGRGAL